ncbi:MAG: hypothetical protein ACRDL7_11525, partial [Gaiellaceae bacterium]
MPIRSRAFSCQVCEAPNRHRAPADFEYREAHHRYQDGTSPSPSSPRSTSSTPTTATTIAELRRDLAQPGSAAPAQGRASSAGSGPSPTTRMV